MSFDSRTGHFILTISMAKLWLRADDAGLQDTEAIASRLRTCGIGVHEVCPAWVRCDMRPGAVWQALCGLPPKPSRVAHFWTPKAQELHSRWAADELLGQRTEVAFDEPAGSN